MASTSQIAAPATSLAPVPTSRPTPAPTPDFIASFIFNPPVSSSPHAPTPAPIQAPSSDPMIGTGTKKVANNPPAKPPSNAPAAPRLVPPAFFEPRTPATNSNSSPTPAIATMATNVHTLNIPGRHQAKTTAPITISQLPGNPSMTRNNQARFKIVSMVARRIVIAEV